MTEEDVNLVDEMRRSVARIEEMARNDRLSLLKQMPEELAAAEDARKQIEDRFAKAKHLTSDQDFTCPARHKFQSKGEVTAYAKGYVDAMNLVNGIIDQPLEGNPIKYLSNPESELAKFKVLLGSSGCETMEELVSSQREDSHTVACLESVLRGEETY